MDDLLKELENFEWIDWLAWIGLAYVILKQIMTENRVTFESQEPHKEHLQRWITALFYVPFVPTACFRNHNVMKIFVMVMIFQGTGEYIQIVFNDNSERKGKRPNAHYKFTLMDRVVQILSLAPSIGFFYSHMLASTILYNVFFVIIMSYLIMLIFQPQRKVNMEDFYRISLYFFGIMWISWPLSHVMVVLPSLKIGGVPYGSKFLTIVLLTSWASDVAGYYFGKKLGKTKAMPHISPNKTVEGFIAQLVFGIGFCLAGKYLQEFVPAFSFLPPVGWFHYFFIGFSVSFFGAFGDFLESFIKRMGGVKDSGTFFRGHGGILDRFDTFLLACPVTFYYIVYFVTDGPNALF